MRMTTATRRNLNTRSARRRRGERNSAWVHRMIDDIGSHDPALWSHLLLLGGTDQLSFRVRIAQSPLRPDLLPSYWSEAALLLPDATQPTWTADIVQVPLLQPAGGEFATGRNGVVISPLADFNDAARWPNIALMAIPRPLADIRTAIAQFCRGRDELDALSHVLRWLAYVWGTERPCNPLHDHIGLPSACLLEAAFARQQFDLTPGVEPSKSCPEAIWASARHWHQYYAATAGEGGRVPACRYCTDHEMPISEAPGERMADRLTAG